MKKKKTLKTDLETTIKEKGYTIQLEAMDSDASSVYYYGA